MSKTQAVVARTIFQPPKPQNPKKDLKDLAKPFSSSIETTELQDWRPFNEFISDGHHYQILKMPIINERASEAINHLNFNHKLNFLLSEIIYYLYEKAEKKKILNFPDTFSFTDLERELNRQRQSYVNTIVFDKKGEKELKFSTGIDYLFTKEGQAFIEPLVAIQSTFRDKFNEIHSPFTLIIALKDIHKIFKDKLNELVSVAARKKYPKTEKILANIARLDDELQEYRMQSLSEDTLLSCIQFFLDHIKELKSFHRTVLSLKQTIDSILQKIAKINEEQLLKSLAKGSEHSSVPSKKKKKKKRAKAKIITRVELPIDSKKPKPPSTSDIFPLFPPVPVQIPSPPSIKSQWPMEPSDLKLFFARKPQPVTLTAKGKTLKFQSRFLQSALRQFLIDCFENRISLHSSIFSAYYHSKKHASPKTPIENFVGCAFEALFTHRDKMQISPSLWDSKRQNGSLENPYLVCDFESLRMITFESPTREYPSQKAEEGIRQFLQNKEKRKSTK